MKKHLKHLLAIVLVAALALPGFMALGAIADDAFQWNDAGAAVANDEFGFDDAGDQQESAFSLDLSLAQGQAGEEGLTIEPEPGASPQPDEATANGADILPLEGLDLTDGGEETATCEAQGSIPGGKDNAALFEGYLNRALPGVGLTIEHNDSPGAGRASLVRDSLTGSVVLYDALVPLIQDVAAGRQNSTEFYFTDSDLHIADHWWSASDLGVGSFEGDFYNALLAKEGIDARALFLALIDDFPYDLYWFDKTVGYTYYFRYSTHTDSEGVGRVHLVDYKFSMAVSEDYAAGKYTTNDVPARVNTAISNIKKIVNNNASLDDFKKLTAYSNTICKLVEYDHDAWSGGRAQRAYGDPWQLVCIFDNDPSTKVVCEGYSKGFKYLCDLSRFNGNVGCVLVMGTLTGSNGAGAHMWNTLAMPDGRTYLVDLTNCDGGDSCTGELFLKGCSGKAGGPYVCAGLKYEYDADTIRTYGKNSAWLNVSDTDYDPADPGTGEDEKDEGWTALQRRINDAKNGDTIALDADVAAKSGDEGLIVPAGKSITLDLAGHAIDRALTRKRADGYVIKVQGELVIQDSAGAGKITGGWNSAYGGGVYVDAGYMTLLSGAITGNHAARGGGVYVSGMDGYFVMADGEVSRNTSDEDGGGVYISHGSVLVMSGGKIVHNQNDGVFVMERMPDAAPGRIILFGDPVVFDNLSVNENNVTYNDNIDLTDNVIFINSDLGEKAKVGVYKQLALDETYVFTTGLGANGNIHAFQSDVRDCVIKRSSDGEEAMLACSSPTATGTLLATMKASDKTALKVSWTELGNVDGCDVFLATASGKFAVKASVAADKSRVATISGLKQQTLYRAYVQAWVMDGSEKTYLDATSPIVYAYTSGGNKTWTNPKSVTVKPANLKLPKGGKVKLEVSVKGTNGRKKVLKKGGLVRYVSSDDEIATVTNKGEVKGVGLGSCTVYAYASNGVYKAVKVTVAKAPTGVSFKKKSYSVKVGKTISLAGQVTVTPKGAVGLYTWSSKARKIATVDANGRVKGIRKGKATIVVKTSSGKTAETTVEVK